MSAVFTPNIKSCSPRSINNLVELVQFIRSELGVSGRDSLELFNYAARYTILTINLPNKSLEL